MAKSFLQRRRLLRIVGFVCVSLLALYVLLCEAGFFRGVPMEPPDRITVYRDGQSAVFDRRSPEYRAIWSRLKPYGKSTLLDAMLGRLPEDQHNAASFGEQVESYLQYGTALRLSYDREQAGPISGDPEDGWNELLYLLDYPELPPEEPGCLLHPAHENGHMLLYETAECFANDLPARLYPRGGEHPVSACGGGIYPHAPAVLKSADQAEALAGDVDSKIELKDGKGHATKQQDIFIL